MRSGILIVLLVTALVAPVVQAEELDGEIKGGKAKKLVDKGLPLIREAKAMRTKLLLAEVQEGEAWEGEMRKCARLYDEGTLYLAQALEIRYDRAVNALLVRAARELAKTQARLAWLEHRRRYKEREAEKARNPQPEKKPDPKPEPKADTKSKPRPKEQPSREQPAATRPRFIPAKPPAVPTDATPLPREGLPDFTDDRWLRREKKGIEARLKDYYGARRRGKLTSRCKLCAAKGKNRDGTVCEMCRGAGQTINLYYFRKAYWNSFTPLFRDADGALDALKAYLEHARSDPKSLGPTVKAFKLAEIEPHNSWARVRVQVKTDAGESEQTMTLIRLGSAWFFFHPATDEELLRAE